MSPILCFQPCYIVVDDVFLFLHFSLFIIGLKFYLCFDVNNELINCYTHKLVRINIGTKGDIVKGNWGLLGMSLKNARTKKTAPIGAVKAQKFR